MAKRFNEPNFSFIIETLTHEGEHLCYWRIDQSIAPTYGVAEYDRLHNQVNRHLNALTKRLGLKFGVVASSSLAVIDEHIKLFGYVIS